MTKSETLKIFHLITSLENIDRIGLMFVLFYGIKIRSLKGKGLQGNDKIRLKSLIEQLTEITNE